MCEMLHSALGMETGYLGSEGQCQGNTCWQLPPPLPPKLGVLKDGKKGRRSGENCQSIQRLEKWPLLVLLL